MFLPDIKRRILCSLRTEPANHFELASRLEEAPFRVRAELKDLKRHQFVYETFSEDQHLWVLTARGHLAANNLDQLELA